MLLHTLGVIVTGSRQPEVAGIRSRLIGRGATVYAPDWPATDPRTAALLNGLAGRSIELCEGHRYVSCQGAAQVLPTGLASAEWLERSGREALMGQDRAGQELAKLPRDELRQAGPVGPAGSGAQELIQMIPDDLVEDARLHVARLVASPGTAHAPA